MLGSSRAMLAQGNELIMKTIPSSSEQLPAIGIGARNYRLGEGWAADTDGFMETIRLFHHLGGKTIDTSPNYGDSEAIVGDILARLGIRDEIFIASKVDREMRADGEDRINNSMGRLHTDHFELLQVHNLIGWQNQLPLLYELKMQGRLKYIGITTSNERQYAEMEQIMKSEDLDFIQVDYAIDQRAAEESLLPLANDRGIAVLVNMPFGRGRLFRKVAGLGIPDFAAELDCSTWAQFLLKYVISHPAVTVAIPGTTKPHHLVDNLTAGRGLLPDDVMRRQMREFIDQLDS